MLLKSELKLNNESKRKSHWWKRYRRQEVAKKSPSAA